MILRNLSLALGAVFLCAATEPPPPPAALQPYLVDGGFDPGDYGWLKGRFQDATPDEAADFRAIMQWSSECRETAMSELREQLAAEGFPDATLEGIFPGPFLCRAVGSQPLIADNSSFAAFAREVAVARPVAEAYLAATRLADETARPSSEDLARQLEHRSLGEQIIRKGLTWVMSPNTDFPEMSALGRAIFQARIGLAMADYDRTNTEWLKGKVAEHGWPTISEVGETASNSAWLLVQHADADPLFQLRALRMMEPLAAQGEVSRRNYAYLYDRIMLKLAGKQRYGTQYACVDGQYAPQPIEDEVAVDRLRREAGMETLAESTARMRTSYGPCRGPPR